MCNLSVIFCVIFEASYWNFSPSLLGLVEQSLRNREDKWYLQLYFTWGIISNIQLQKIWTRHFHPCHEPGARQGVWRNCLPGSTLLVSRKLHQRGRSLSQEHVHPAACWVSQGDPQTFLPCGEIPLVIKDLFSNFSTCCKWLPHPRGRALLLLLSHSRTNRFLFGTYSCSTTSPSTEAQGMRGRHAGRVPAAAWQLCHPRHHLARDLSLCTGEESQTAQEDRQHLT